ncbi:hypothetical protein [Spirosoma sp.]|uniref:hypothetical protein n=1 Tax=Spirosoma sp. TaxID=1899569 RepID=UPI003B3B71AD
MINSVRYLLLIAGFYGLLSINGFAQSPGQLVRPFVYSASSEWQKVTLRQPSSSVDVRRGAAPETTSSPDFRPAFTADFVTNRNYWKAGTIGDYRYQIGRGSYSIRKRNVRTQSIAISSVPLPQDINLNRSEIFTIKLDVLADSGKVPTGGLLFGVKDSLNYCAFTTNDKGEVAIKRVANGETFSDYMPGVFFRPGVAVDKNRNRLTVKRRGEYLHFYINEKEVRSSPYLFRMLPGNGIGLTSSGYWTGFQKLSVTVGL